MASHDRTEKPTPKRLEDARKKGQVVRSRDVVQTAVLAAGFVAVGRWGGHMLSALETEMTRTLAHTGDATVRSMTSGDVTVLLTRGALVLGMAVGPVAAAAATASVMTSAVQTGLTLTLEPLSLNFGRLNPAQSLRRIITIGWYEFLKMSVLVTGLTMVGYWATKDILREAPRLSRATVGAAALIGWGATDRLLRHAITLLAVVASVDYAVQRYRHRASLRMTKQEVKDEERQREGNPEIKARVRRVQREMVRRRMLIATRRATVVVTNPTHYAVALDYRRATMSAPRVVAKGRGFLALRIKEIAREANVPIVEQVALAQALYRTAQVGETIPADLFEAVAEVLAYLIRLKQLVL